MPRRSRLASPADRANGCAMCSEPVRKSSRVVDGALGDIVHQSCQPAYREKLSMFGDSFALAYER